MNRAASALVCAALVLASCTPVAPRLAGQETALGGERVVGIVDWGGPPARTTQADPKEIASGATVSIIDLESGETAATTVSDPDGRFTVELSGWAPTPYQPYALEAVKGLRAGGNPNRVGAPAARLRTIIAKGSGGWISITGAAISINRDTTTVAIAADLLGFDKTGVQGLLGSRLTVLVAVDQEGLASAKARLAEAGVTDQDYADALAAVGRALDTDRDPMRGLVRDSQTGKFALRERSPLITGVSKAEPKPGETLEIYGSGFDLLRDFNTITIGGVPVTDVVVDATGTKLSFKIPEGASGTAQLAIGAVKVDIPIVLRAAKGTVKTFAGTVGVFGFSGDGGPAAGAKLHNPRGITVDDAGIVYVGDMYNWAIRKVTPDGTISTIAGNAYAGQSSPGAFGNGGPATQAGLAAMSLTWHSGAFYFGDIHDVGLRTISPAGIISKVSGSDPFNRGSVGVPFSSIGLFRPHMTVFDSKGNMFHADRYDNRIYKVNGEGTVVAVYGTGGIGAVADGPIAGQPVNEATALALDAEDNLYYSEAEGHRVRKIDGSGNVTTVIGTGAGLSDGDGGPATAARVSYPMGLAFGRDGALFVAEYYGARIRKVGTDGIVTTYAGTGMWEVSGLDGPAAEASIANPAYLATDAAGSLYATIESHHVVLKIE